MRISVDKVVATLQTVDVREYRLHKYAKTFRVLYEIVYISVVKGCTSIMSGVLLSSGVPSAGSSKKCFGVVTNCSTSRR